jgi:hypothetical protein
MIDTYLARRPCTIGRETRDPGLPVPEAHLWRLTDGLVTNGVLEPTQLSEADFEKAVEEYCPDDADAIYDLLGLEAHEGDDDDEAKAGDAPKTTRRRRAKRVLTKPPEPMA